ncbi:hypothetical protein PIB30_110217 [Stylosanthes scabra]|uniref:UBN2 domain-containing protein n=1 Tax=Stylosanthes scabra TaxID=79078 RepID=A0ABU6YXM2_9FABA|nr:hypothetical protein [Stylosanthes scabra]
MLGKTFTEEEIVDKVLWSPPKWDSKITAIEEGRNFNTLTYDQLRGNLIAYEVKYLNNNQVEEEKKKKGLALKASSLQEEEDELEDFEEDFGLVCKLQMFGNDKESLENGKKMNF